MRFTSKYVNGILCLIAMSCLLTACGKMPNTATVSTRPGSALKTEEPVAEVEEESTVTDDLFIIENVDMAEEKVYLYSVSDAKQLCFPYTMTTRFLDKYGNNMATANFTGGTVVVLGEKLPASGALGEVRMASGLWELEDIDKYSIDHSRGVFSVGEYNYRLSAKTKIYSNNERILITDLTDKDTLKVIGRDKDVLSIAVTTGHGFLDINSTERFNGSLIFIGTKIVSRLEGPCTVELPEGTYKVTFANDGWGGSAECVIERGATATIDLEELKGEGPKYCLLTFLVTVPDTFVYLDGEAVDTNEPIEVRYGNHKLAVQCAGYTSWNKTLVVNSESATITLALEEEISEEDKAVQERGEVLGSTSETGSDGNTTDTTDSTEKKKVTINGTEYDYERDYLTTISDILGSMIN